MSDGDFHKAFEKAGVMHWFEPVYEEPEFTAKKGEWVVITDFGRLIDMDFSLNRAYQLEKDFSQREFYVEKDDHGQRNGYFGDGVYSLKLRKATPSEIAKAKEGETKVITMRCEGGTFEIEVSKKGIYYRPEKAWINIANIRDAISATKVGNQSTASGFFIFKPTMLDAGCKKGTYVSDWEKVLEEYERICKS